MSSWKLLKLNWTPESIPTTWWLRNISIFSACVFRNRWVKMKNTVLPHTASNLMFWAAFLFFGFSKNVRKQAQILENLKMFSCFHNKIFRWINLFLFLLPRIKKLKVTESRFFKFILFFSMNNHTLLQTISLVKVPLIRSASGFRAYFRFTFV